MECWSTDSLAEHERFALWREWRAAHLFGITAAPRILRQESGRAALFAAYARSFFANIGQLDVVSAKVAVDTLGRLAMLAYDSALPIEAIEGATTAIATGRLHLVQAFVRANLQTDLSPETVARRVGMSLRQLHRLFEPTGTTFARYVIAKRTERVAEILAGAPSGSIIDTAFACGFSGTSAFYRAFKAHYGMSPSDWRHKGSHPTG